MRNGAKESPRSVKLIAPSSYYDAKCLAGLMHETSDTTPKGVRQHAEVVDLVQCASTLKACQATRATSNDPCLEDFSCRIRQGNKYPS